ncbi:MAG: hypothetical protein BWY21_00495 [Parcubacteria group bacterium ADurb.Bin216]|nr:MAG: hypothetical protein BWY21_00495 [Parcubacteria group bacterium ADurb.Bin216]
MIIGFKNHRKLLEDIRNYMKVLMNLRSLMDVKI